MQFKTLQCNSRLWFHQQAVRITASKFKDAVRTDVTQPKIAKGKWFCPDCILEEKNSKGKGKEKAK